MPFTLRMTGIFWGLHRIISIGHAFAKSLSKGDFLEIRPRRSMAHWRQVFFLKYGKCISSVTQGEIWHFWTLMRAMVGGGSTVWNYGTKHFQTNLPNRPTLQGNDEAECIWEVNERKGWTTWLLRSLPRILLNENSLREHAILYVTLSWGTINWICRLMRHTLRRGLTISMSTASHIHLEPRNLSSFKSIACFHASLRLARPSLRLLCVDRVKTRLETKLANFHFGWKWYYRQHVDAFNSNSSNIPKSNLMNGPRICTHSNCCVPNAEVGRV